VIRRILSMILACVVTVAVLLMLAAYLMEDQCETQTVLHTRIHKDNRYFSLCRDRIYIVDEDHEYMPLFGHDEASFSVLPFFYAKDKDHVYYVAHGDDLLGGSEVRILPGADPVSFKVLDTYTSKDSKHTYRFPYLPSSTLETYLDITDNTPPPTGNHP